MINALYAVILCGGAGTRLWPVSRQTLPKPFARFGAGRTLFERTSIRARRAARNVTIICIAHESQRRAVSDGLKAAGLKGDIVLEPETRNSAPALTAAALHVAAKDPDGMIMFMPADHDMDDEEVLARACARAAPAAAAGLWVNFGVTPRYPATAYGYLLADGDGPVMPVTAFVEKPDIATARRLIKHGALWNSGIGLVKASVLLEAVGAHAVDILMACRCAYSAAVRDGDAVRLGAASFAACRPQSIDYAVLEHYDRLSVMALEGEWSDAGSWDAMSKRLPGDDRGNRGEGDAVIKACTGTYVRSPHRLTVALGLDDVMIVDTPDALLVAARGHERALSETVGTLDAQGREEVCTHPHASRSWGHFDGLARGGRYRIKKLSIMPGAALSLHYHRHRAEHWVVVKGVARVTRDKDTFDLNENESTYIPVGVVHRLENPGERMLEVIEIQLGARLEEDDIVRVDDMYGRVGAG